MSTQRHAVLPSCPFETTSNRPHSTSRSSMALPTTYSSRSSPVMLGGSYRSQSWLYLFSPTQHMKVAFRPHQGLLLAVLAALANTHCLGVGVQCRKTHSSMKVLRCVGQHALLSVWGVGGPMQENARQSKGAFLSCKRTISHQGLLHWPIRFAFGVGEAMNMKTNGSPWCGWITKTQLPSSW